MTARTLAVLLLLMAASGPAQAEQDKSGISPSRLKLPKGPGSIEGIGENAEPNINMGLVGYSVPFGLPAGYNGFSPSLGLSYSSGGGSSVVGLGWSLNGVSMISRMTSRGLPDYDRDDLFEAGGGEELVRVDDRANTYRARYEGGFVRYTWHRAGAADDYWRAEYPDGTVGYFGADQDGNVVDEARLEGTTSSGGVGTFSYMLVEKVDPYGHRIQYDYSLRGRRPYLSSVSWVFGADDPRYRAVLTYESREDVLSDGKPGFEVTLDWRLRQVRVLVQGKQRSRYELQYEPYTATGGMTRLARVRTFGRDDLEAYPVEFSFEYTGSFDPACETSSRCETPYVVEMGEAAPFAASGSSRADLTDMNGDGLPDVVDTGFDGEDGHHAFYLNELHASGTQRFVRHSSCAAGSGSLSLSSPSVRMADVNGDGLSDMADFATGQVLYNPGYEAPTGDDGCEIDEVDWQPATFAGGLPDVQALRFLDINYDRQVDFVLWDEGGGHGWLRDRDGYGTEQTLPPTAGSLPSSYTLADMNGDGMPDLAYAQDGLVSYQMNLGHGRFAPPREMYGLPLDESVPVQFTDLNGDNLADAVMVADVEVRYALNRNGRSLEAPVTIDRAVRGPHGVDDDAIPRKDPETAVRFADMNGSGSTDIVYITADGQVSFLELVPRRPNLLSRVDNGIGKVIEVHYGTSVQHMARDAEEGVAWKYRLPQPMLVLDRLETYDTLSRVRQIQTFHYRDGYYDGEESQFRGFEHVEVRTFGDDSMEPGVAIHEYLVGRTDRYYKGLLDTQTLMGEGGRVLKEIEHWYDDCSLAGQEDWPELERSVRFICKQRTDEVLREEPRDGPLPDDWVTLRTRIEYDGYGNPTLTQKLGVVQRATGCGACADPALTTSWHGAVCGDQCLGDEMYEAHEYVAPGPSTDGRWLIRAPYRKQRYGVADDQGNRATSFYFEEEIRYDGDDAYEGLPLGTLTHGTAKRRTQRAHPEDEYGGSIDVERFEIDEEHGLPIGILDANGNEVRVSYDEDPHRLLPTAEIVVLDDYRLRMEVEYEPTLEQPELSTGWMLLGPSGNESARKETHYQYDRFGRLSAIVKPGDADDAPTQVFDYTLADPVSAIVARTRSKSDGPLDLETIQCLDGMGRKVQERVRIEPGQYQVTGYTVFNIQGKESRIYQPYLNPDSACAQEEPPGILYTATEYDAAGRVVRQEMPDWAIYGEPSESRTFYGPLRTTFHDPEDWNSTVHGQVHQYTPTTTFVDGQGRTIQVTRRLEQGEPPQPAAFSCEEHGDGEDSQTTVDTSFGYDTLGQLSLLLDDAGNCKQQDNDTLGRARVITDPDTGTTVLSYDRVGNVVGQTDARGITVKTVYDAANRPVRQHDAADEDVTLIKWHYDRLEECDACTFGEGLLVGTTYPLIDGMSGEDRLGYDQRGRPVYSSRTYWYPVQDGDPLPQIFEFSTRFDNADRQVAVLYPTGHEIEMHLDGADRVTSVPGFLPSITYTDRNQVDSITYVNSVVTQHEYDEVMRLSRLSTVNYEGGVLQDYIYAHDRVANILSLIDYRNLDESPTASAEYEYDQLYRLTGAVLDPRASTEEHLSYGYGNVDNFDFKLSDKGFSSVAHVGEYQYGEYGAGPHAVHQAGTGSYRYDAAGNMVIRRRQSLRWDHLGRLAQVREGPRLLAQHGYDTGRQRVIKKEGASMTLYVSPDFEVRAGVATIYISGPSGRAVKFEVDAGELAPSGSRCPAGSGIKGAVDAASAYQVFIECNQVAVEVLEAAARRSLLHDGEAFTILHQNHLGTTSVVTDLLGATTNRFEHFPYGESRYVRSGRFEDYSWTGQERDQAGLSYHAARNFDPALGRWIRPDPLFRVLETKSAMTDAHVRQVVAPYVYGLNAPVRVTDPSGLDVVVYFSGMHAPGEKGRFQDLKGRLTTGKMAQEINKFATKNKIPDVDVLAYGTSFELPGGSMERNVVDSMKFVKEKLNNPNEKVIIYGFSAGGEAAMMLAERLGQEGIAVDSLFVVDAYVPKGFMNQENAAREVVPSNVRRAINFRSALKSEGHRGKALRISEDASTQLSNMTPLNKTHGDMDEATMTIVQDAVKAQLQTAAPAQ